MKRSSRMRNIHPVRADERGPSFDEVETINRLNERREHGLVHEALRSMIYGTLQDLRDRSLRRRDIADCLEELLRRNDACRDMRCEVMTRSGNWTHSRFAVEKQGQPITLTDAQLREWRKEEQKQCSTK